MVVVDPISCVATISERLSKGTRSVAVHTAQQDYIEAYSEMEHLLAPFLNSVPISDFPSHNCKRNLMISLMINEIDHYF